MMSSLLKWFRSRRGEIVNWAAGCKCIPTTKRTPKRPYRTVLRPEELESRIVPATGYIYGEVGFNIVRIDASSGDEQSLPFFAPSASDQIAVKRDGNILLMNAAGIMQFNPASNPPVPPTYLSREGFSTAGSSSITVAPDGAIYAFTGVSFDPVSAYKIDPSNPDVNGNYATVWQQGFVGGGGTWPDSIFRFNQIAAKEDGTLLFSGYEITQSIVAGVFEFKPNSGQIDPTLLAGFDWDGTVSPFPPLVGVAVAPDGTIYGSISPSMATPGSIFKVENGNMVPVWEATDEGPSTNNIAVEADGTVVFVGTHNGQSGVFQIDPAADEPTPILISSAVVSGLATASSTPKIKDVKAQWDENDNADKVFGEYLKDVELPDKFTVTLDDSANAVKSVKYKVGTKEGVATRVGTSNQWTFDPEVWKLSDGLQDLTITIYDTDGKELNPASPYKGQIKVRSTVNLDVTTNYGDVDDLRLVDGVPLTLTYTATVNNLPFHNRPIDKQAYATRVKLVAVDPNNPNGRIIVGNPVDAFENGVLIASISDGYWPDVVTDQEKTDYRFELVPKNDPDATKYDLAQDGELLVIARPHWLNATSPSFDPTDVAYHFDHFTLDALNVNLPAPGTGVDWLDQQLGDLSSEAKIQASLSVHASLQLDGKSEWVGEKLTGTAKVLGKPVWNTEYSPANLVIEGPLTTRSLDPAGVSVKLKTPEKIGDWTFFDKDFTISILPKSLPHELASVDFLLKAKATGTLTINAGLGLDWINGAFSWNTAKSFVEMTSAATVNVSVEATASLANGWIEYQLGVASASMTLTISGQVHFGGNLTAPSVSSGSLIGTLKGSYGYEFFVEKDKKKDKNTKPEDLKNNLPIEEVTLFAWDGN